jgi:esterase/lipase superfamily enzyme
VDNLEIITNTTFDPKLRLTIIVHGFMQDGFVPWISKMRKELMKKENMNIIVVNWEIGASALALYDVAAGNTRLVGAQLVKLITKLRHRLNYEPSNVHVIGHSLGAHVAGFAGASLSIRNMKIRRITGKR